MVFNDKVAMSGRQFDPSMVKEFDDNYGKFIEMLNAYE